MINLFNRTEFSFRIVFGHLEAVMQANDPEYMGICDRHGTWGHVAFQKLCKKKGVKPIFGVELATVPDPELKEKQPISFVRLIARNNPGLRELYEITSLATQQFYYFPLIGIDQVKGISDNICIATSRPIEMKAYQNVFLDLNPATREDAIQWAIENDIPPIASSDNYYPRPEDFEAYQVLAGINRDDKTTPMYILDKWSWGAEIKAPEAFKMAALDNARKVAERVDVTLPQAQLVKHTEEKSLEDICRENAKGRGIDLSDPVYDERLRREIGLIYEKNFEDYFYMIADLVIEAKKTMLVGPARGSSCGSLVCYLLHITDVDPIPYSLLFERFIDINRADLPDIDIDFPDIKRDQVLEYLKEKYGADCVAQLGTVNKYKAKNTIVDVAKVFNIPPWEVEPFKESIIERFAGDARANMCIADTFENVDIGKETLIKFPELEIATQIEGHSRHSGKHAAALIVTSEPIKQYCSVDSQTGAAQVDKYDAEDLNLLKIDALGLRTLSVIEDCLAQIKKSNDWILNFPLDDQRAFDILNDGKFTGIFQFEGGTLQGLSGQIKMDNFEDVIALTALARPGPLSSGMSIEWISRRIGKTKATPEHPILDEILKDNYGIMVYQEEIMRVIRELGGMSWEDVSLIRKAISKSMGGDFFDQYKPRFLEGAEKNGYGAESAATLWERMKTFGAYAFNRSHAVAYAMVSYWCMVLKAYHPVEYAAACLRHSKDDDQVVKFLRELDKEGIRYKAFDQELSKENWSVQDGVLIGGLIGVKGIGIKTATDIIERRKDGRPLTKGQQNRIDNAITPYDVIFECRAKWSDLLDDPMKYNIASKISEISDIGINDEGVFLVLGKLKTKNQKDMNSPEKLKGRHGKVYEGQSKYMTFKVEDDSDEILCYISPDKFMQYGDPIMKDDAIGDWYVIRGKNVPGIRLISVDRIKRLGQ